jgi:hypothetical protein
VARAQMLFVRDSRDATRPHDSLLEYTLTLLCQYDRPSKPYIHWLAFECQNTEHALMDAVEGFAFHKSLKAFEAERELADRERLLRAQATLAEPMEVLRLGVFGPRR